MKNKTNLPPSKEKLHDSVAKFKTIYDISPGLICVANANNGIFTECNLAVTSILGWSVKEFTSKPFKELIHPDDWQSTVDEITKQLKGKPIANFENRYRCKDGSYKWLAWQATAADMNGLVYAVATDINDRKQATQALLQSEKRYQDLYNNSPDMYVSVSAEDASILLCNNTLLKKTGYSKEEIIGSSIYKLYHDDCMVEVKKAFQQFVKTGLVKDKELILKRKDSSKIDVSLNVSSVRDATGKILYSVSSWRDNTERKKREEKIKLLMNQQIALNHLFRSLGKSLNLEKMYQIIEEHVIKLMPADAFIVSLYDSDEQLIRASYVKAQGKVRDISQYPPIPFTEKIHGVQSEVIRSGKILYVPDWSDVLKKANIHYDIKSDGSVVKEFPLKEEEEKSTRSGILVPMKISRKITGVMQVQSFQLDAYSQNDIDLLDGMANVAAIAIQNTRLYQEVQEELSERKQVEDALKERMKELRALYNITEISIRPEITLDEMFRESVNQIPPSWQYPEVTCGCITIGGKVYKTKNFKQTKWMQRENIQVKDEIIGNVEVCYLQEKPDEYEGPFLKEERELIENFAKQLSEHITRKRAEEELKKLSVAVQQSPVSIVITDTEGNIEYVNPKFSELTGYSAEEAIGKNSNILKTGVTSESEYKKLWNTIKKGETWVGEFLNKKKNGELYCESATISPILDDKNNITHFLAIKEDITKKKEMINDLMEREEKFRTLTYNLHVGVYRSTPGNNGMFIEVNPAFLKIFEFSSKDELKRYKAVDFYSNPHDRNNIEEKLLSKGFLINEEVKLRKKDGTRFSASISATVAKDESGKIIHYDGIIEDVTEEHKTREDILTYQSNLKSLTNELLVTEEEAKRRLAMTLHDKLLQSLVLASFKSSELNTKVESSEHKKMLKEISGFIEDAINEARNITYELSPPVLYEMGLIPAISWKLEEIEKNNKIKTSLTDQSNSYEFDEKEQIILYRSISELLQNVIKHSKAKEVNISFKQFTNDYIITISDNGIGFDLETMREKAISQKKFGLFSLMERIKFIGGEVLINTEPNKGTKAVIKLPIKQE